MCKVLFGIDSFDLLKFGHVVKDIVDYVSMLIFYCNNNQSD